MSMDGRRRRRGYGRGCTGYGCDNPPPRAWTPDGHGVGGPFMPESIVIRAEAPGKGQGGMGEISRAREIVLR